MKRAFLTAAMMLGAWTARADDFFASKIEPVLKQRCYECHSHEKKMKGGLTLDSRSGWQQGGDDGPAIVPGKPDESLLIKAIRHDDPDLRMPKEKLPEGEIALLEEWVKRGAPDPRASGKASARQSAADWWAVKPLIKPAPPEAGGNPIDAFIRAKLAENGLQPSPEADRRTLIRRLTFDLHGLPPSPEEVEAFVNDPDPGAYEKLVDRLLASPRYGERWARHWLDVAHYGESNGFGMDRPRMNAWPYRDYVIRAFNDDKPYTRFVREQLAADALFPDEPGLTVALGFLAAGPFNQSALAEQVDGTNCKKIALNLDRDDMVSSTAATFLSVTLHCARCHDHKFDPISQRDYYAMQSVFAGVARGGREFDADASSMRERLHWQEVRRRLENKAPLSQLAVEDRDRIARAMAPLKVKLLAQEAAWQTLDASIVTGNAGSTVTRLGDGSFRFGGDLADTDVYTAVAAIRLKKISALRVEVLADDAPPTSEPGAGDFVLTELKVTAAPADAPDKPTAVKIKQGMADWEQGGFTAKAAFDGQSKTGWAVSPRQGHSHQAVFVFDKPITNAAGSLLTLRLEQMFGGHRLIGRLRLSISGGDVARQILVSPDSIAVLKETEVRDDDALQSTLGAQLADEVLASLPPMQKVWAVGANLPPLHNYKAPKSPYPICVLARGDVNRPGVEVNPGALEAVGEFPARFALPDPQDEAARRAALARWITEPANPLTWRSIVNRVWAWHFGRGIVETPNDFGKMGGRPSHPELLDWLACEFRDSGGSFKKLHRLIVTSAAYRQAVTENAAAEKLDGDDRLLWRGARHRLDAEQLRDALLEVSGKLDLTMGGPSAMQFNFSDPNPNVSPRIDYDGFDPDAPASLRRGIYRFLFRNTNDALLETFDAANPSLSTPRRNETITPLQALSLYNNRFVLRQCEHFAARLEREAATLDDQIDRAYLLLFSRRPTAEERQALAAYAARYGLANTCRVLVNANEFLFIN